MVERIARLRLFGLALASAALASAAYYGYSLLARNSPPVATSAAADSPPAVKINLGPFSSDNKRLFIDYCDAQLCRIGSIDLQSGALTLFTPKSPSHELLSPALSLDGGQLAIVIRDPAMPKPAVSQLGILNLQDRTYRVITNSPTFKEFPSFAPDGSRMVFAQANRERTEGRTRFSQWDIYELDLRSGSDRRLTQFCFYVIGQPQYLADGKTFIFSGDPTCFPGRGTIEGLREYRKRYEDNTIFRMTAEHQILEPFIVRGPSAYGAALARNADKIVFGSRTNDLDGLKGKYNYDLFLYENGSSRRLTNLKTMLRGWTVSNDARLIAYESDPARNGKTELWLMDVERITHRRLIVDQAAIERLELTQAMQ